MHKYWLSKNGTNEFHGSADFQANRPGLNAYQRWNGPNNPVQRDTDRFNQWAGSLGGPILKNRLFFFFSYETLRNDSISTGLGWYETPQYISTVTSAVPNGIGSKILGYPGEGVSYNAIIPKPCAQAGIKVPAFASLYMALQGVSWARHRLPSKSYARYWRFGLC